MYSIKVIDEGVIFDNPLPQLRSRHAYFPSVAAMDDGSLMASFAMGEAFESVDLTTMIAKSCDGGKTWEIRGPLLDKSKFEAPVSDTLKITNAGGGKIIAAGYWFPRKDPDLPIGNPETGGILDDEVIFLESHDYGNSWTEPFKIETSFRESVEASAPLTVLKNGWLAAPIANFSKWDGTYESGPCGHFLVSGDGGRTWNDNAVTMRFPKGNISVYEQRMCQLDDGRIVVIAWNEDLKSGERLPNHFSISEDSGGKFSPPKSTGIMGQTSGITHIGGGKVLALHCIRCDTDKPGIYAYVVDLSKGEWDILCEERIWGPKLPLKASANMAEVFSFVKFGQPSAIPVEESDYLMVNWVVEDGQGRIVWRRLHIDS